MKSAVAKFDFALEIGRTFGSFISANLTTPVLRNLRERPMRRKITLEEKWHQQAETYKEKAAHLPYGKERDELLRLSRQLETASRVNEWLTSPGLQPPKPA
jgi:hypothetical protein